jgi:hypothetical protein
MRIERGVVAEGSRVRYRTKRLDVRLPSVTTSIETDVEWSRDIEPPARTEESAEGRLSVSIPHATFYRAHSDAPPPSADRLHFDVKSPVDLAGPLRMGGARAEIGLMKMPDLRWLEGAPPSGSDEVRPLGGSAEGHGRFELSSDGDLSGRGALRLHKAGFTWEKVEVEGDAQATFDVIGGGPEAGVAKMRAHVDARDVVVRHDEETMAGWWAVIDANPLVVRPSRGDLVTTLDAKSRDARLVTEILEARGAIPSWLSGMLHADGTTANARVVRRGDTLDLTLLRAKGGDASASGRLVRKSKDVRGAFVVKKGPAAVGVSFGFEGSGVRLFADEDWLRREIPKVEALSAPR